MNSFTKLSPCKTTDIYDEYWKFAQKRQDIFFKRIRGLSAPWTDDEILEEYKFTNAYRASDRVSQYLIKQVIYDKQREEIDTLFRILLFKTFNKIETWKILEAELGEIVYSKEILREINGILTSIFNTGTSIYSGAYIMHSGKTAFHQVRKHSNHLLLMEYMINDGVLDKVLDAKSMCQLYDILISYPTIGSFLAYQYTIDINYSKLTNFGENDFVVPGPGALDGISKVFLDNGGLSPVDLIKLVCDRQEAEFERLGIDFQTLWGRSLQLIDCQNLFCEISKYSRISHPQIQGIANRTRIKQKYTANPKSIELFYPPKWRINAKVNNYIKSHGRNNA